MKVSPIFIEGVDMLYICRSCTNGDHCRENMGMCLNGAGYSPKDKAADAVSEYETMGQHIGKLVAEKNAKYGDSFHRSGDVLRILYPNGIKPEQFDDALCVVRIIDKLFRVATDRDALGESPYCDIAGYGILGTTMTKEATPHDAN